MAVYRWAGNWREFTADRADFALADKALTQKALEDTRDPAEIIESDTWIPLDKILLPFPDLTVNAVAADRFAHGQEVVVFHSDSEPIEVEDQVAMRAPTGALIGIGTVKSVLARGRTLNIQPAMVLAEDRNQGRRR